MTKVEELIEDIECLHPKEKKQILDKLKEELLHSNNVSVNLNRYKGIAKNIWDEDAQKYINELRKDDRI